MADEFQQAGGGLHVQRTIEAVKRYKVNGVILGGGVAANSHLRAEMHKRVPGGGGGAAAGAMHGQRGDDGRGGVLSLPGRDTVAVGCGCCAELAAGVIYRDGEDILAPFLTFPQRGKGLIIGVRSSWRGRSGACSARLSVRIGG